MKAWMLSIAGLVRRTHRPARATPAGGRRPGSAGSSRPGRRVAATLRLEGLEGRALMAVAPASPIASIAGSIADPRKPSSVVFRFDPGELRADQSASVVVGFAVVPATGSPLSPAITKATGPTGQIKPVRIAAHGDTAADRSARQTHLFAQVAPSLTTAQDITVSLKGLSRTTGDYIVQAYLAGDVNGDGSVDSNDLAAMQAAYGSRAGQANYNPAADVNGDGRVGCIDRTLLTRNLGTHYAATPATTTTPAATTTTVITPAASAAATVTASALTPVNSSVPLAAAPVPVNLVPQATAAASTPAATPVAVPAPVVPVAVATPIASAPGTVSASSATPVAITPAAATPILYTPVYAPGSTGYAPVMASGTAVTGAVTAYPAGTSGTPVYLIAQPAAGAAAPVYIYGQPVVGGATAATWTGAAGGTTPTTAAAPTAGSILFGGGAAATTPAAATGTTPIPVYLYGTPTYPATATPVAVATR